MAGGSNKGMRAISYPAAFAISLAIHGLVLMILGVLFALTNFSDSKDSALIFELMPGTEINQDNSPDIDIVQASNPPERESFSGASLLLAQGSAARTVKKISKEDAVGEGDETLDQLLKADPDGLTKQFLELGTNRLANAVVPRSLNRPRYRISQPKLEPPKLPISDQQQNQIHKTVQKVMERLVASGQSDTSFSFADGSQIYHLKFHRSIPKSPTDLEHAIVEIETENGGQQLATVIRMQRLAFSHFAQLVDHWDPQVAIHNDVLKGRFHSNYAFVIRRSAGITPRFHGKVTTAAHNFITSGPFPWVEPNSVFQEGIEIGVKPIRLPRGLLTSLEHPSLSQVHRLAEESWVTFQPDGSFLYCTRSDRERVHRVEIRSPIAVIIGNLGVKIHVKGAVNGMVLVYSQGNIVVDDDLIYACPPERCPNSDDLLGLVSERDVEIAPPSVTGPGDLQIYAAIYARRWFRVSHLIGSGEATLYIYGSLSAGCLTATEPRYATRICFDERFQSQRPPHFPLTDQFDVWEWSKEWEVKSTSYGVSSRSQ